jgi:hypothetical protein
MSEITITKAGLFSLPRKAIPLKGQDLVLVMGDFTVYTYDPSTGVATPIQASTTHKYIDIACSDRGEIMLLMEDVSGTEHMIKILDTDFFDLKARFMTSGLKPSKCTFSSEGNAVATSDDRDTAESDSVTTLFHRINFDSGVMDTESLFTQGYTISMNYEEDEDQVFTVTSGGEVWLTPGTLLTGTSAIEDVNVSSSSSDSASSDSSTMQTGDNSSSVSSGEAGTVLLTELGYNVSATSEMLRTVEEGSDPQEKIRIFVGSRPWANDRWDSGEVTTSSTEWQYGGGDNLQKGQKYWVHIMTYHASTGWSRPQIKEFVVPR